METHRHGASDHPVGGPSGGESHQGYAVRGAPRKSLEQGAVKKHVSTVSWMGSTVGGTINMAVPQLAGAIDIVAVLQPDGTLKCSPFYVRFGKYQVHLHQRNKDVAIVVNGRTADFGMNLSSSGEAYFVSKDNADVGKGNGSSPPGSAAGDPQRGGGGGGGVAPLPAQKPRGMLRVSSEQEMLGAITEWYSAASLASVGGCSPPSEEEEEEEEEREREEETPGFVPGPRPRSKRPGKLGLVGIGFGGGGGGAAGLNKQQQQQQGGGGAGSRGPPLPPSSSTSARETGSRRNSLESGARPSPAALPPPSSEGSRGTNREETKEEERTRKEGEEEEEELYLDATGATEEEKGHQEEEESAELRIEVSLCGREVAERRLTHPRDLAASFARHRVAMQDCVGPGGVVGDEEALMVRVNGHVYPWREVAAYPDPLTSSASLEGGARAEPELSGRSPPSPWHGLWPFNRRASLENKQQQQQSPSSVSLGSAEATAVKDVALGNRTVSLAERALNNPRADEAHLPTRDGRSLVPTSEQLQSLGLRLGQNTVEFVLNQHIFGDYRLRAFMYLMPWNSRLVVSDVDGTITRSDVLGHLMPAVGMDWSHSGVVSLLSDIYTNGYMVMYLSSRAISQAGLTRDFLQTLKQGDKRLPNGPIVISPDGLFPSLYREVVVKRPHEFKIATLSAIRSLFPDDWNPFYAGFGNRGTDEVSYKAVGISPNRIFTINPKGEIKRFAVAAHDMEGSFSSLGGINTLVDAVFPPMMSTDSLGDAPARHEFSDVSYWKSSFGMELIDSDDEEQMAAAPTKPPVSVPVPQQQSKPEPVAEPEPEPTTQRADSVDPPFAYMSMHGSEGGMM